MTDPKAASADGVLLCGRYRLHTHLASGGMGEVWRATDVTLQRPVAVKLLHDHLAGDPDLLDRFRREARAAARLNHPGIVAVYDTCSDGGRQAIVLQLVEGPNLRTYLDRVGCLTPHQTVTLGVALADALAAAHDAGVVHRDVQPANVLLGPERAMLTDFGVAKALDEMDHTATGTLLGSVRYLSPEQVRGITPGPRSDLFSLGVMLYECLRGDVPWDAATPAATALARLEVPAPRLGPHVPPALADAVNRCLATSPADRPADARSLAAELLAALDDPTDVVQTTDVTRALALPGRPDGPGDHTEIADGATPISRPPAPPPEDEDEDEDWPVSTPPWTGLGPRGCAGPAALTLLLVTAVVVIVALLAGSDPSQWLGGG